MSRPERSVKARIAEHMKYRRQCEARIKSGARLCAGGVVIGSFLLWRLSDAWLLALVVIAIPVLITSLEAWGFRKHDRALKRLLTATESQDNITQ